jgi:sugar/nucleoside kinase (ribokinase family)
MKPLEVIGVGDNEFGRRSLKHMEDRGVDLNGAIIKPDGKTYFCMVMLKVAKRP